MIRSYKKGFTLIELLVVVSIISLLSSIIFASLNTARDKAQVAAGLEFDSHNYELYGVDAFAMYNFNEASGNALDSSGNGRNLVMGSIGRSNVVPAGKGKSFIAGNGYATLPSFLPSPVLSSNGSYSVSGWVYLNGGLGCDAGGDCPIVSIGNTSAGFIILESYWNGSTLSCYSDPLYQATVSVGGIQPNRWYQVTCSLNATNQSVSLYLNGKLVGTQFQDPDHILSNPGFNTISVGGDFQSGYDSTFNAYINNVRIYQNFIGGK